MSVHGRKSKIRNSLTKKKSLILTASVASLVASGGQPQNTNTGPNVGPNTDQTPNPNNTPTAGDDIFINTDEADVIDGGSGVDVVDFSGSTEGVEVALNGTPSVGGTAEGDIFTNIENIVGTPFDDVLTGNELDNVFFGLEGADTIDGGDGNDTVDFSTATESIVANLSTGVGAKGAALGDTYANIENITGSEQDDFLTGSDEDNRLIGLGGNDFLAGQGGDDELIGGAGADLLRGGLGADILNGGDGEDLAVYNQSGAAIAVNLATGGAVGGEADGDTFVSIEGIIGTKFNDIITGNDVDNKIAGIDGNDQIRAGAGNDLLSGGLGDDLLDGGDGIDTVDYSESLTKISVHMNLGSVSGEGADILVGIENVIATNFADRIDADGGDNVIKTLDGDDYVDLIVGGVNRVELGKGDDGVRAGAGADFIDGGEGKDYVEYLFSPEGITIDLMDGSVSTGGFAEGDVLIDIEDIYAAQDKDDIIFGNDSDNVIFGNGGNDEIHGRGGNDSILTGNGNDKIFGGDGNDGIDGNGGDDLLDGGAGDDILRPGKGTDVVIGGAGEDRVSYVSSTASVVVDLKLNKGLIGDAVNDTYEGIENARGGLANDVLFGNDDANLLIGYSGNDIINGAGGSDVLRGELGADELNGGDGLDTADYSTSETGVTVNIEFNGNFNGDAQGDVLNSIENLIGSEHDDFLTGDSGINVIEGGIGADAIDGRAGVDAASYESSASAVLVSLFDGTASGGDAEGDTLILIEDLYGSKFDDSLTGNADKNTLFGLDGNDNLSGEADDDFLNGGAGDDVLLGGAGDDILAGGAGDNRLFGGFGKDILSAGNGNQTVFGDADFDTYSRFGQNHTYKIEFSENKIGLIVTNNGEAYTDLIQSVEKFTLINGISIASTDVKTIWNDLSADDQGLFGNVEQEFLNWLGDDAGYNYDGI